MEYIQNLAHFTPSPQPCMHTAQPPMPPSTHLPGLDTSLHFSRDPLDHLFLVLPGAGDPYIHHPPWLTSLPKALDVLQQNYNLLTTQRRRHFSTFSPPTVLFLPLEWHTSASITWQNQLQHALPQPPSERPSVRDAVADTMGDMLLMGSEIWRQAIAKHVTEQINLQIANVKRNRPRWSGRLSFLVHSIGALILTEMLTMRLLSHIEIDSVVFGGCVIPMYAALAPDAKINPVDTIRNERPTLRFVNVFHPLDPVAYRLEPMIMGGDTKAVRVKPIRIGFWEDAGGFWEDVVESLWDTLFAGRGGDRGGFWELFGQKHRKEDRKPTRKNVNYEVEEQTKGEPGEVKRGGSEVLLSDRIDYELQDGMGVPRLDVLASWGAIKAHTYYWQSLDVAQIILDIAVTSDVSMESRKHRDTTQRHQSADAGPSKLSDIEQSPQDE